MLAQLGPSPGSGKAPGIMLSLERSGAATLQLRISGLPSRSVILQTSRDLRHWVNLATDLGAGEVLVSVSDDAPARCYRVSLHTADRPESLP